MAGMEGKNGTASSPRNSVRSDKTEVTENSSPEFDGKSSRRCSSSHQSVYDETTTNAPVVGPTHTVSWTENDPDNPHNWSSKYKLYIVLVGVLTVLNSTLGSSLPSNAIPFISAQYDIKSPQEQVLPISLFLVGYIFGPLLFGPLSEHKGRRSVTFVSFFLFTIFTLACALAPNYPALLVFRLLTGISASSPVVITGGLYADIYPNPVPRGRAMAFFMTATVFGPLISPILSGFVSTSSLHWRWTFWIGLIFAGASWVPLIFLPETYGPVLLSRRAAALRKSTGDLSIVSAHEIAKRNTTFRSTAATLLARPLRMLFLEPLVFTTSLYLSLAYAIFYMYFEAYPIVFQGLYGLSPGVSGLMFLPIGAGAVLAVTVFFLYDSMLQRARAADAPWSRSEEARRLPLACLGGPLYVVALFWLGWTAREDVPWVVPMLAGIPFGAGFLLIFIALLNYLTDAYEVFAASALAATSMCRSVFGAVLPLAATPMYDTLGVDWASSLLGFTSLAMCCLPFLFLKWGNRIRGASRFCQELKTIREETERTVREKGEREDEERGRGSEIEK